MKTVKEWMEELPEPYRSQALENQKLHNGCSKLKLTDVVSGLKVALSGSFVFSDTPQGWRYWHRALKGHFDAVPTPTERQTAEALLKEFGDWWNEGNTIPQDTVISEGAVRDFINDKYGKG